MRSIIMRVILVVMSVLILIGVLLMLWMLLTRDDKTVIKINLDIDKSEAVEFNDLDMIPGETCEYTITFSSAASQKYNVGLKFAELEAGNLADYAYVRIEANGIPVCDELLATSFASDGLVLPMDFSEVETVELRVVYYLPLDVGNEAQNASARFELQITASNE